MDTCLWPPSASSNLWVLQWIHLQCRELQTGGGCAGADRSFMGRSVPSGAAGHIYCWAASEGTMAEVSVRFYRPVHKEGIQ